MAVARRRLLRSVIWAASSNSMASAAVVPPLSTPASTSSRASRAPGHLQIGQLGRDARAPGPGLHESAPAIPA